MERLAGLSRAKGLSNPDSVVMGIKEREELTLIVRRMTVFPNPGHKDDPETFMGLIVIPIYQRTCLMVGTIVKE